METDNNNTAPEDNPIAGWSEEQIQALAEQGRHLGSTIVGWLGDQQKVPPILSGLGCLHACVFFLLQAGFDPESIGGFAEDHANDAADQLRKLHEQHFGGGS